MGSEDNKQINTWIHAVWTPVNIVLLFIISFSFRHGSIHNKFDINHVVVYFR